MKQVLTAGAIALAATSTAYADARIETQSPHSVSVTLDRLIAAVEGAGAKVFARVDHAAGAKAAGMEMRPTQMLMFGNPKLGTPAMRETQTIGLDLPLRVLAYETEDGRVLVTYQNPADLAKAHGADAGAEVFGKMTGALDKLTDKAISE